MGFFDDALNGAASVFSAVGDVVEVVTSTVADVVSEGADSIGDGFTLAAESAALASGNVAGPIAAGIVNVVGGIVVGLADAMREVANGVGQVVRSVGRVVASLLRLDLPGAIQAFLDILIAIVGLFLAVLRFVTLGHFVGGIVHMFERSALRSFIEQLLRDCFGTSPEALRVARETLRMEGIDFGLHMPLTYKTIVFDSASTDLATLHNNGAINLYALAGLDTFAFGDRFLRARTVVTLVNEDGTDSAWPINRFAISRLLSSQGKENRLRVFSLARTDAQDRVKAAVRAHRRMAIHLEGPGVGWGWPYTSYPRQEAVAPTVDPAAEFVHWGPPFPVGVRWFTTQLRLWLTKRPSLLDPPNEQLVLGLGVFLRTEAGRTGEPAEDAMPLALSVPGFALNKAGKENFGICLGRDIMSPGDEPLVQTGPQVARDDGIQATIMRVQRKLAIGSGVVHRDAWPDFIHRTVLAHELGHYVGLGHPGHSLKHIMFSAESDSGSRWLDPSLLAYYFESTPGFSLADAQNCWRFVVDQMRHAIVPPP